jgi:hypothetical protein
MHLFVGKSMFGRQMEMERIMDFLIEREHKGTRSVQILPIVGPKYICWKEYPSCTYLQ